MIARVWRRLVTELDLDGYQNDGKLSYTKVVTYIVLFSGIKMAAKSGTVAALAWPAVVLILFALFSAHGRKVLVAAVNRMTIGIAGAGVVTNTTEKIEQVSHVIMERRKAGAEDGTEPTD